jgi:RHS repeat-associated protein
VNEFLYCGEQYDASLGMYYLRARYYVPRTGRFLTADKYEGEEVGACDCSNRNIWAPPPGVHHLFGYAGDDPINKIDPSGHDSLIVNARLFGAVVWTAITQIAIPQAYIAAVPWAILISKYLCAMRTVAALARASLPNPMASNFANAFCAARTVTGLR